MIKCLFDEKDITTTLEFSKAKFVWMLGVFFWCYVGCFFSAWMIPESCTKRMDVCDDEAIPIDMCLEGLESSTLLGNNNQMGYFSRDQIHSRLIQVR